MSKLEKLRRKLLTDDEARYMTARLKQLMGEPVSSLLRQYGISAEDHFRFHPLAVRLEAARIERGLSLKAVATALRAPKYRLTEIEASQTKSIDPGVLIRYVEYLGLKNWFGRWKNSNASLARRLQLAEAGNLTTASRATRRKRRAPEAGR